MKQFIVGECLADFLDFDGSELELRRGHGEFRFGFGFVSMDVMFCRVCERFDQDKFLESQG